MRKNMLKQKENMRSKSKRTLTGRVVSDGMQKTVTVNVERTGVHSRLKKVVHSSKKYKVHDELQQAHTGDIVRICEGRPKSKTKYMYLVEVVRPFSADRSIEVDVKESEL